jgi:hypothetical protein
VVKDAKRSEGEGPVSPQTNYPSHKPPGDRDHDTTPGTTPPATGSATRIAHVFEGHIGEIWGSHSSCPAPRGGLRLENRQSDRAKKARAIFGAATGKPRPGRRDRARLIVAALSEQIDSGNAKLRSDFETAVQDVLDTQRFGNICNMTIDSDVQPAEIVEEAKIELDKATSVENGEWLMELGLKGAIALAALGHLRRGYATSTEDAPRPYQIIDSMLEDEFGLKLLGDAIQAWRDDKRLPEYDADERTPKRNGGDLRPATLGKMFSGERDTPPEPTARDLCESLRKTLRNRFVPTYEELIGLPEVRTEGIAPDAVEGVLAIMEPVRKRLELNAEKYRDFHGDPNADAIDEDEE